MDKKKKARKRNKTTRTAIASATAAASRRRIRTHNNAAASPPGTTRTAMIIKRKRPPVGSRANSSAQRIFLSRRTEGSGGQEWQAEAKPAPSASSTAARSTRTAIGKRARRRSDRYRGQLTSKTRTAVVLSRRQIKESPT